MIILGLNNLRGELVRKSIRQAEVADFLGMTVSNFNKKLSESIPLTVDEIKAIRSRFLPHADLEYLLVSDGNLPSHREKELANLDALQSIVDDAGITDPAFQDALDSMRQGI